VPKARKRRYQYRYIADQIIDACRLQHRRIENDGEGRHDLDFYVLSAARLRELIRQAHRRGVVVGADEILSDFDREFPHLQRMRDWLAHPADVEDLPSRITSCPDAVYAVHGAGVDELQLMPWADHVRIERYYDRICDLLGELPQRS
jgi:hypothetical protein